MYKTLRKKNQQISTFSFPEFWKNQAAVFPYPKCPASECPGNGGTLFFTWGPKDPGEAGAKGWFIVEWNMGVSCFGSCGSYPYRKQGTWRSMEKSIIFSYRSPRFWMVGFPIESMLVLRVYIRIRRLCHEPRNDPVAMESQNVFISFGGDFFLGGNMSWKAMWIFGYLSSSHQTTWKCNLTCRYYVNLWLFL